jgi:hypothetical protein
LISPECQYDNAEAAKRAVAETEEIHQIAGKWHRRMRVK